MENQNQSTTVLYGINEAYQTVTEEEMEKFGEGLTESQTDEIEIGDAPEEVKKFTILADKAEKELEPLKKEHKKLHEEFMPDEDKYNEILKKISAAEDVVDTYRQIASRAARLSVGYPLENLDLRKGWKIVTLPEKNDSNIELAGVGIIGPDGAHFFDLLSGKKF